MTQIEPVVLVDPEVSLPPGQRLWTGPEMFDEKRNRPYYTMGVVAQVFFCRSTAWLRKHMRPQRLADGTFASHADGRVIRHNESSEFGLIEPPRTPKGHHAWRLYDIERLAYALHENNVIKASELQLALKMIKLQAQGYGYLS